MTIKELKEKIENMDDNAVVMAVVEKQDSDGWFYHDKVGFIGVVTADTEPKIVYGCPLYDI